MASSAIERKNDLRLVARSVERAASGREVGQGDGGAEGRSGEGETRRRGGAEGTGGSCPPLATDSTGACCPPLACGVRSTMSSSLSCANVTPSRNVMAY